ncbi:GNAT family N-acetyltransferase [Streptomyces johnsoniae]|uniref:GNAT family N-acetyltransferase n=1 Tax=Streptomyces johnsoniae TaxID=3075532 RepID=A0ABU2SBA3_9ACTN|nr:GNAT family N-acetyltransferase [Streptomyces sp. DSM 41886]MDT0446088.1 GNAT family N-acetyltransferase [Streptomyces sp. DSM 41886]
MSWRTTHDAGAFVAAAGDFLASRPVEHTVLLTLTDALRRPAGRAAGAPPPWLGWWQEADGRVLAALVHTPPGGVQVSGLPASAVAPLAGLLAGAVGEHAPTAVDLPAESAAAFTRAWGQGTAVAYGSRLYRLGTPAAPEPAPHGRARSATAADRALLTAWATAFCAEVGMPTATAAGVVEDRLRHDGIVLWEHEDGAPVAMATLTRRIEGTVRVAFVYTPPEHRRCGYAAAVTAAAGSRALAAGAAEIVLFTDVANATTNALYQRLGYRPVSDRVALRLPS